MEKNINGLVSQMNRINVTVGAFKFLVIFVVAVMAVVCVGGIYLYTTSISSAQSRIYVLDQGRSFSASAQDPAVTREDEIRDHVRTFHELMFNLAPSNDMIRRNLEKAFQMCDKSAYRYYNDLQERSFYKRLTSTNSYQQIDIEKVDIDMSSYPFRIVVHGHQYITRESNISQYTFVSRCRVTNVPRTPNNLHGLMIEEFDVIENNLVETRNK